MDSGDRAATGRRAAGRRWVEGRRVGGRHGTAPVVLENATRVVVLADHLVVARGFWARGVGLLGRASLDGGEGLLLAPCGSIHMLGMRFAIDALFLDGPGRAQLPGQGRCLAVCRGLAPGRFGPLVRGARCVIELPAGAAGPTQPGDGLRWWGAGG